MDAVCGLDVGRDKLAVTVLGDGFKESKTFGVSIEDLSSLKDWLRNRGCCKVVMESTGVYWVPVYASLEEGGFEISLANSYQVKAIPGRKTDQADSEWLAYLLRAELVKPSYVPEKKLRVLRSLARLRTQLKQDQSKYKNRVHKILQVCNVRLDSKLTDIFGKSGRLILDALMSGRSLDEALDSCPKNVRARGGEIKATIMGTLDQSDLLQLRLCIEIVDTIEERVHVLDAEIAMLVDRKEVERISRVPGVKEVSASSIIAELGDARRFPGEKQVGCYAGLVPSVRQSGMRRWSGGITKKGSKWLRRMLIQCALAAIKVKDSKLRLFYLRVKSSRGHNVAIVAVARKILVIIHHLLVSGEEYAEEGLKPKRLKAIRPRDLKVPFEDALSLLARVGFLASGLG